MLGMNLLTLKVWAPWALSVFCKRRGSSSLTWATWLTSQWSRCQSTFPFLCEKCGISFSKSCWGVTVASMSLHKAMFAFSLTLSLVSPSLKCDNQFTVLLVIKPKLLMIWARTCRLCWLGRCWDKAWNLTPIGLSGTRWCLTHSGKPKQWGRVYIWVYWTRVDSSHGYFEVSQ